MSFSNEAAWLDGKGEQLKVRESEAAKPEKGQLLIKNGAVAINPVDWKMQDTGFFISKFPYILGCDVAGEVAEVGEGVTGFSKGQRVLAHPNGIMTGSNAQAAFQRYTVVNAVSTAPIPDSMSFEEASVLPLSVSTAAAGMFQHDFLGLPHPSLSPEKSGKVILVWGASSSVGTSVVQLAVAAGVEVVATASKRNFDYVKKLGARAVFDYNSPSIAGDLTAELQKGTFAGAYDAISTEETQKQTAQVVAQLGGGRMAIVLQPQEGLQSTVTVKNVFAPTIFGDYKDVGKAVYQDFLPQALKTGQFKPLPEADVIGKGLEHIQAGMTKNKEGVSAKKVVISL